MIFSFLWGIPPRLYALLSVIVLTGLMLSCSIPEKNGNNHSAEFENIDSEDVPNNPDSSLNWYRFYTNDPQNCQRAFVSASDDSEGFSSAEVLVKKEGGYEYADFGLAVHTSDETYMALVIDIHGNFRVLHSGNGEITDLVNWTFSTALKTGYGAINSIKLVYVSDEHFSIYLNDQNVGTFDTTAESFLGWGFFAYVASENYEQLESSPVEVYYASM